MNFKVKKMEKEIHISDYLKVILKHKFLFICFVVMTVSMAMFSSFIAEPIYQSTAKLIIDKERDSSPITGRRLNNDYESYASQTMTFNTHFKLIQSQPVIESLIDDSHLRQDQTQPLEINPFKRKISQFKTNIKTLLKIKKPKLTSEERRLKQIKSVQSKIAINQIRETRLLTIDVKDKNPTRAAELANTLAKKYIEFNMANKMEASKQILEWLNNELYAMRRKLEDAETAFFNYKRENKVFSISGKQKMAVQKIIEFNNRYLDTRNKRLELDARINELSRNIKSDKDIANIRSLVDNPMIETIYGIIMNIELELTRLLKIYKSKHPKIVQLKTKLEKSRKRLSEEVKKELGNLKSERKVLLSKERTLEKTIAEFESDALETSGKELKYTILQRNVNTSQNLYDLMVSRVKESDILQSIYDLFKSRISS
ncbi:MAG: GumC family protein [Desulfobacteraceae bacterium]|nr:GumC family protein [Desulfobacteraceae bacterium]